MRHTLFDHEVHRPPEFAKLVGVTKPTIMAWIRAGKIKAHKIGSRFYIPDSELGQIVSDCRQT